MGRVCRLSKRYRIKSKDNWSTCTDEKFDFLVGTVLGEIILRHCNNISLTLQKRSTLAAEGQIIAKIVIDTISELCTDASYDVLGEGYQEG